MIEFSYLWVHGFGWQNTIYIPEDFEAIEVFGRNEQNEPVYVATDDRGKDYFLK